MSSNEAMSKALTCKNCLLYRYACTCEQFVSVDQYAYDCLYGDNEDGDEDNSCVDDIFKLADDDEC